MKSPNCSALHRIVSAVFEGTLFVRKFVLNEAAAVFLNFLSELNKAVERLVSGVACKNRAPSSKTQRSSMMEEEITIQVENNTPSAERILRPITYTSWFLGVGVARPHKCPKIINIILRGIHLGVCSVIVAYGAIDFFTFGAVFKSDIFKIMYYMNKVTSYVSSYYYVYHGIRHYKKWPELMEKIECLDRKIKREVRMNDGPVTCSQILAILATLILGPISLIIHALYYYFTLPKDIFASDLLLYYTIAQTLVNSFVFDVVVYLIYRRFLTLNQMIERLDGSLSASWVALKLRQIRELHNGICDLVTAMNEVFGLYLLMCSINAFTMVLAKLFRIYMSVVEKNSEFILINNIIWIIYATQFGITCWVCTMAYRESNKTGIIARTMTLNSKHLTKFHKLSSVMRRRAHESAELRVHDNAQRDGDSQNGCGTNFFGVESLLRASFERDCVRNEVNDFSSQVQQHRVAFSACDFFEMNNALLTGFIGIITTYLIILVQFYRPENLDTELGTTD
ncbi:hypothetical protein KM043_006451 [Ampulex compressa]|nr:hypothetical protein KM043_006451 [Ampulex compressa]